MITNKNSKDRATQVQAVKQVHRKVARLRLLILFYVGVQLSVDFGSKINGSEIKGFALLMILGPTL